jgi:hypothetical protein
MDSRLYKIPPLGLILSHINPTTSSRLNYLRSILILYSYLLLVSLGGLLISDVRTDFCIHLCVICHAHNSSLAIFHSQPKKGDGHFVLLPCLHSSTLFISRFIRIICDLHSSALFQISTFHAVPFPDDFPSPMPHS